MKILSKIKNIAINYVLIYALIGLILGFDKTNELVMNIIHAFI